MFDMSLSPLEHILRAIVIYVFLFVLLRLVGKKHVGELAPFDLLVLLILSETVQNSLVGDDKSLVGGMISATTLVIMAYGVGLATFYSKRVERLVEGTPKILVRHGSQDKRQMGKQKVSTAELLEALRHHGCTNIADVRAALLENNGKITVIMNKAGSA